MGTRAVRAAVVAIALLAGGCGGEDRPTTTPALSSTTTTVTATAVMLPPWPEPVGALVEWEQLPEPVASPAAEITLDRCVQEAPWRWRLVGSIGDVPPGAVSVELDQSFTDMLTHTWFSARALGAGAFDVVVDTRRAAEADGPDPVRPEYFDGCALRIGEGEHSEWVLGEAQSEPLHYEAADGTVEALGIGAVMSDPGDPRIVFAALAFAGQSWAFREVWLPRDLTGIVDVRSGVRDDGCRTVAVRYLAVGVSQSLGCEPMPVLEGPVDGAPGFSWTTRYGHRSVVRPLERGFVQVTAAVEADAVALAKDLRPLHAIVIVPGEADPPPFTADQLLQRAVDRSDGVDMVERDRVEVAEGFASVWVGDVPEEERCADCPEGYVLTFVVTRDGAWSYVTGGGGMNLGTCLSSSSTAGTARPTYEWVVTADPAWRLERDEGGRWVEVGSPTGVLVEDHGVDGPMPTLSTYRAVDADGTVVCTGVG